jgi:hypothetical protein
MRADRIKLRMMRQLQNKEQRNEATFPSNKPMKEERKEEDVLYKGTLPLHHRNTDHQTMSGSLVQLEEVFIKTTAVDESCQTAN